MIRSARIVLAAGLAASLMALGASDTLGAAAGNGRFAGLTDQYLHGKRGKASFSVAGGVTLRNLKIDLLYDCPKYGQWPSTLQVKKVTIQPHSGIFLRTGNFTGHAYGRYKAKVQIRLAGRFTRSGLARGQLRAIMSVITAHNHVRDTCPAVANFWGSRQ